MEQALFAPGTGYYSANVATVGRHGDFSTSATASTLLGTAVAEWIKSETARHPGVENVIEVGGGDGSLSASVREALGWWKRRRLQWHMVETSPVLAKQQAARLNSRSVRWHRDLAAALESCGGSACIFHNELVDAFPVRVLQWNGTAATWDELWLEGAGANWSESLRSLNMSFEEAASYSAVACWSGSAPLPHPTQRIELHTAYRNWLLGWSSHWKGGAMLTIDYGDVFPQVYHRQPRGTLRAYARHQRLTGTDVYARMGRQDITADVNFTDLIDWGTRLHWQSAPLESQRDFLTRFLPRLPKSLQDSPAAAFLLDEYGAGSAFRVLIQRVPST